MFSLKQRFILSSSLVLLVLALVFSWGLSQRTKKNFLLTEQSKSESIIYALIAASDLKDGDNIVISGKELDQGKLAGQEVFVLDQNYSILFARSKEFTPPPKDLIIENGLWFGSDFDDQKNFMSLVPIEWEDEFGVVTLVIFGTLQSKHNYLKRMKDNRNTLIKYGSLACLLLLLAQTLILNWSLIPLKETQKELKRVKSGKQDSISDHVPTELKTLTKSLNELLHHLSKQNQRFQHALADLAHQLKTPISAQKSVVENHLDKSSYQEELLQQLVEMNQVVNYHLQKSQLLAKNPFGDQSHVRKPIERLQAVLNKAYADKNIKVQNIVDLDLAIQLKESLFMELFGNVFENAFKWAKSQIYISTSYEDGYVWIHIEDDGPGIPEKEKNRILDRGYRADQSVQGTGHGMAIVADLINDLDGKINIQSSKRLGGAYVSIGFKKTQSSSI